MVGKHACGVNYLAQSRVVVAKEPRVLALDTASTVPRKLDGLTRALAAHAARGGDGEEAVATAAAQVLRYYPNALRLDPATLAGKLEALRGAGLSPETVLSVVGGAPRCLSAAARTLEQRVSTLKEAFPSICVDGMLGKAPRLLQNRIDPAARVRVKGEERKSVREAFDAVASGIKQTLCSSVAEYCTPDASGRPLAPV